MEFKKIVAITGMSGLYYAVSQRTDGMIVSSIETGKTNFVASRIHQFTFLDSITMYMLNNESKELSKILLQCKDLKIPIPQVSANNDDLRAFFTKVEPEHDQNMVHISDIRKFIKWYAILDAKNLLPANNNETPVKDENTTTEIENTNAQIEIKPQSKKTTKTISKTDSEKIQKHIVKKTEK